MHLHSVARDCFLLWLRTRLCVHQTSGTWCRHAVFRAEWESLGSHPVVSVTNESSVVVLEFGLGLKAGLKTVFLRASVSSRTRTGPTRVFDEDQPRLGQHNNNKRMQLLPCFALLVTPRVTACPFIWSSFVFLIV